VVNALIDTWNGLDGRRRGMLVGGAAALLVTFVILARLVTAPGYALLYAGLDPAAAGDVIAAVEGRGVPYRVEGDAILVDQSQRDTLRMALAGEGLPANGAAGYELLDGLSGFGTTSQMFDAAYWRAKEGELARTISASAHIRAARVHIANPGSDPFQPTQTVTASVALSPAAGGLGPGHARALRYLVASSVPGLLPENVTVLDADSGQVLGGADTMTPAADAATRAEELRRNIERLLAARVGPGNAVVQVNIALETTRETIRERTIDPDSRVAVATESEDRTNTSRDAVATGVTVASNLPDGDAAAGGDGESSAQGSETRERVTFDISETQREIAREPGDIRRLSVAVLLNGVARTDADGIVTLEPRPPEEVAMLEALVRSAMGFDTDRGDALTISSMAFDESVVGELVTPGLLDRVSFDLGRVIQTLVLAAAALFIAFGLLRPLLRRPADELGALSPAASMAVAGPAGAPRAALPDPGPETAGPVDHARPEGVSATPARPDAPGANAATDTRLPAVQSLSETAPDPVERLRRLIEEREEETVEILRSWMEDDEEVRP
jgi:flagellar M-ring protein FliF